MRRTLALAVAGCLTLGAVGCATNELQTRREVARAALSHYPAVQAKQSATYKLAAVDDQGAGTVEILNLTDNTTPQAKVWVNGRYVSGVPAVPARSSVTVKYGDLLEAGPGVMDLGRANSKVAKVELEVNGELFVVQGPTIK
jgi:hypothetical protein